MHSSRHSHIPLASRSNRAADREIIPTGSVFISGSRSIRHLPPAVAARIDSIAAKAMPILIGDAPGADAAVQSFLAERGTQAVRVFCSGRHPRTNVAGWPVISVRTGEPAGTRAFYEAKDRAMSEEASAGLVIWDGVSRGSLANVRRLVARRCYVLVYLQHERWFLALRSDEDRAQFLARYG